MPLAYAIEMKQDEWFKLYQKINQRFPHHILLESGRAGKYSMMAYSPTHYMVGKNKECTIYTLEENHQLKESKRIKGSILETLREWMNQRRAPRIEGLPDFRGGLLGLLSYDLVREIECLEEQTLDDLETPDMAFYAFNQLIVYDHEQKQAWLVAYFPVEPKLDLQEQYQDAQDRLVHWSREIQLFLDEIRLAHPEDKEDEETSSSYFESEKTGREITPSFSESSFIEAVSKIQEYIAAGDVFQVNLSVRQSRPLEKEPLDIYEELRRINPSPYMGFLQFPDIQIISASPEQLIKLQDGILNTRPIAGTRPRGANREEDLRLAGELINNEKERAEHVMLVDLERNDLGKVCRFGTVEVDEFMVIEEYSHVMHIVSNVKGELAEGKDAIDVIKAVFPGGTITGAPKVRTMEIIEELEPVRRGIYTGSIGWIDYNGDMELNIVIRTMLAKDGVAHVQAGAGIVIDSIPENEYRESLKKAEALWKALELSKTRKKELSM